jgi:aminopeptidase YwaD
MIEDGDFDIPSAFMTEEEGERLAPLAGQDIRLEIKSRQVPATGCNVTGRKGTHPDRRVVICAHIDAKDGTPGALDNAAGITTLLLLAEMLKGYSGRLGVELVAINGEDYYSNPGEQLYLRMNEGRFGEILLAINLDGVGYTRGKSAYSLYECTPVLATEVQYVFSTFPGLLEGEPWYQGDHSLFLMNGCPALAVTSEKIADLMARFIHTPEDLPEIVDPARLVEIAEALYAFVISLDQAHS